MIEGIFPPVPTPFLNNEVQYDKLADNILKWNKTNLSGYVVLGSNSETAFLTKHEKIKIIGTVFDAKQNDKLLIAGTGSDSFKETIELTNEAGKIGADAALVLTPSFYKNKMNNSAMINYFTVVADNSMIPIIIYNVPKFTNVDIEPETVAALSKHKNIVGIKNSSENIGHLSSIISKTDNDFSILIGTASVIYPGLIMGASGGILALANIAPNLCMEIFTLVNNKDFENARVLQMRILDANKAVTSQFGIAGLKTALNLLGYYGGETSTPLSSLEKPDLQELERIILDADLY